MRIIWEVDDGYAGKNRPQYTDVPDDEILDCETKEEVMELIASFVNDDYDQRISWYFTDNNLQKNIAKLRK